MGTTILALLSGIASAVASVFGYKSKKLDLKNTADVKDAEKAQSEIDANSKAEQAIARRDVKEIQNELAE